MFTSCRHDDVFCAISEERQCAFGRHTFFTSPVGFRMAVAKMGETGRTLRERKSFQPPVFYSALRGLHCLRAGGGELGSFPTGSSASNRRPMFHNKMSVAMAGRQKVFPPGRKPPFPPVARKCFPGRDGLSRKPPSRRIWSGFPPGRMPPFIRNPGRMPPLY